MPLSKSPCLIFSHRQSYSSYGQTAVFLQSFYFCRFFVFYLTAGIEYEMIRHAVLSLYWQVSAQSTYMQGLQAWVLVDIYCITVHRSMGNSITHTLSLCHSQLLNSSFSVYRNNETGVFFVNNTALHHSARSLLLNLPLSSSRRRSWNASLNVMCWKLKWTKRAMKSMKVRTL